MESTSLTLFDLVPGNTILERYKLIQAHRQSGMSAVFEAEDTEEGRHCEVQVFPSSLFEGPEQAAEFGERIGTWRALSGETTLTVHDVRVLRDGAVLISTEFPRGQSLRAWLTDHSRMAGAKSVAVCRKLLDGLAEIHEAGLVHGDIKPETIYFEPDGDGAVFVDGGVTPSLWAAKHMGTQTTLIGTPFYAPLELFTGDAPDPISDLYSLSTVLYEQVSGVLPWSGRSFIDVFQSKMQKVPPAMSSRAPEAEVDPALESVVARGLSADRKSRYASAQQFIDALESAELP
jgi:serine/threonine-protein kinase